MTIYPGDRGVESGIRYSPNTDTPVVVGNVFDQPINRVVGVAGLVDLISFLVRNVWAHVLVHALAHVAPAHVLVNEDVAFAREQFIRTQRRLVIVHAIRPDTIGRAI